MSQPGITINGQLIAWPYVMKIRNKLGRDWDRTIDLFWKAMIATKKDAAPTAIFKYIEAGFLARNNKYALLPSKDWEQGESKRKEIRSWWRGLHESNHRPTAMKSELKSFLMSLTNDLE